jgi:hypothetical protein
MSYFIVAHKVILTPILQDYIEKKLHANLYRIYKLIKMQQYYIMVENLFQYF